MKLEFLRARDDKKPAAKAAPGRPVLRLEGGTPAVKVTLTVPEGAPPGSAVTWFMEAQELVDWILASAGGFDYSYPLPDEAVREIAECAIASGVVPVPGQRAVVARLDRIAAALKKPRPTVEFTRDAAGRLTGMREVEDNQ